MSPYRLTYLGIAVVAMGSAVFVAADAASRDGGLNFSAIAALHPSVFGQTGEEANKPEPGNLSEVGAKEITSDGDFLAALVVSREEPVLVFKHSTSCEVSGAAYRRTAAWLRSLDESSETKPKVFLVKVIEQKPVSELIAKQTHVKHESPQVILLRDGKPVWNTSHESITGEALSDALAKSEESSDSAS